MKTCSLLGAAPALASIPATCHSPTRKSRPRVLASPAHAPRRRVPVIRPAGSTLPNGRRGVHDLARRSRQSVRSRPVSPLLAAVPTQSTFPSASRRSQTARLPRRRRRARPAALYCTLSYLRVRGAFLTDIQSSFPPAALVEVESNQTLLELRCPRQPPPGLCTMPSTAGTRLSSPFSSYDGLQVSGERAWISSRQGVERRPLCSPISCACTSLT
ncbi:hypothetical protein C8T65DRAFT_38093 [Cerioporus squamosus]|nr:hypothetical protein C8T65DRAFT_38093 [Cerioporus squamosus]